MNWNTENYELPDKDRRPWKFTKRIEQGHYQRKDGKIVINYFHFAVDWHIDEHEVFDPEGITIAVWKQKTN